MHAISMLHRLLSEHCPSIHKKRVVSLCDVTDAAVSGSTLTLSDLGRGLSGPVSIKHNIKRVDRTIYEEVHPQRKLGNLRVHKSFLVKLASEKND
jgi:hypothetical protein